MNIFEMHDPKTWQKQTPVPYITITDPEKYTHIYCGYNLEEFFKVFDKKYYLEYDVYLFIDTFAFVYLGKVKEFKTLRRKEGWEIERNK